MNSFSNASEPNGVKLRKTAQPRFVAVNRALKAPLVAVHHPVEVLQQATGFASLPAQSKRSEGAVGRVHPSSIYAMGPLLRLLLDQKKQSERYGWS